MIVTAWNNGKHYPSGAGYGLKVKAQDIKKYFRKEWGKVYLRLEGENEWVVVNINKDSFWNATCGELIKKEIGMWLIKHGKARWPKYYTPKMEMEHVGGNKFKVRLMAKGLKGAKPL